MSSLENGGNYICPTPPTLTQMKGYNKMETRKTSISYSDYVRGIKSLNINEQLTLLEIISARLKKSIGKRRKNSIMELEGLGANIWKGIDAQDYVHKERESWD